MQNTTINLQTQSALALDGCKTYSSSSITIITYEPNFYVAIGCSVLKK